MNLDRHTREHFKLLHNFPRYIFHFGEPVNRNIVSSHFVDLSIYASAVANTRNPVLAFNIFSSFHIIIIIIFFHIQLSTHFYLMITFRATACKKQCAVKVT